MTELTSWWMKLKYMTRWYREWFEDPWNPDLINMAEVNWIWRSKVNEEDDFFQALLSDSKGKSRIRGKFWCYVFRGFNFSVYLMCWNFAHYKIASSVFINLLWIYFRDGQPFDRIEQFSRNKKRDKCALASSTSNTKYYLRAAQSNQSLCESATEFSPLSTL